MSMRPHQHRTDPFATADEAGPEDGDGKARESAGACEVYEIVMREGNADDVARYIDGALLIDLWPDLVLPASLRREWQALIDAVRDQETV